MILLFSGIPNNDNDDVDSDGKDEIALSTGDYVLILKPTRPRQFEPIACIPTGTRDSEIWLRDIDGDGRAELIVSGWFQGSARTWFYKYDGPTVVPESKNEHPPGVELMQNYPNPFNPQTTIDFSIASTDFVSLKIYDIIGREVATLVNSSLTPGKYTVQWNASSAASGIYIYRLITSKFTDTKRMMLVK